MDKKKSAKYRELLLLKRRELAGEVATLRSGGRPPDDGVQDIGDEAAQSYAQEVAHDIGEAERKLLRQIDNALDRLDAGEYGVCADCGEKIAAERLNAVPYAELCVTCKSVEERGKR